MVRPVNSMNITCIADREPFSFAYCHVVGGDVHGDVHGDDWCVVFPGGL